MKNSLLLLFITIICLSGGSAFAGVSPQVAQTYWVANGNTISGSASAPVQFSVSTSQSITVQVNGTNNGTSMAPFGGVDVEIREVTGSNGTQINLTSITSPGANSGPNTWWAGTALPTGQTAQCLHMESVWNNWIGGGGQNPVIFTFTPLQPGTYHVYAKMYLSDGSGNLPRDPSGSTPNTDDQGQGTYLIGTITVLCTVNLTAYPSGAGTTSGGGAYPQGMSVTVTATPNSGYGFLFWLQNGTQMSGNLSYKFTIEANISLEAVFGPLETISFATNPNLSGLGVTVDGSTALTPFSVTWTAGTVHTIGFPSPEYLGTGTRYNWSSWSDGGTESHSVTAPGNPITYTAYVTPQYQLTVSSAYGSTSGSGWYNSGATAYAGLNGGTFSGGTGIQYVFSSWGTDASGSSYSQSNGIVMNGPKTATTNWTTRYYLTMSTPTNGTVTPASSGYYNSGQSVQISATPNTGYNFGGWTGTGSGSYSGSNNPANITMNGPITESATFTQSTSITVTTNPPGLAITVDGNSYTSPKTFTNWTPGSPHTISTTSTQSGGTGTQYIWSNWSDGGAISHSVTAPSSSYTYSATFTTEYYLTVNSAYGSTSGYGWYNSGTTVYAGLNGETFSGGTGIQYVFSSWGTDASGSSYSQSNGILMNGPRSATANWTTQVLSDDVASNEWNGNSNIEWILQ